MHRLSTEQLRDLLVGIADADGLDEQREIIMKEIDRRNLATLTSHLRDILKVPEWDTPDSYAEAFARSVIYDADSRYFSTDPLYEVQSRYTKDSNPHSIYFN